ncbi:MAG: HAMP domain-containing histidine kinase [Deltaproteobacteria bacterium]|nr:HAMP domain-containing histidine kinase [Deltaproteobacteria bacterium]
MMVERGKRRGAGAGRNKAKGPSRRGGPGAARQEATPGDEGVGPMARMVAHEVRNALSVMYNVATGLRRAVPAEQPDAEMLLGILEEELRRLDRLTHDLVSFAMTAPPIRTQVRVQDLVERAVQEARRRCPAGDRARVEVTVQRGAATASLDPDRMFEALVGLLRNGIEASNGRGGVRVVATRAGDRLRLDVFDEGPGLPTDDVERIFDPFFSTKASGVGLGLALCRQIARRHGGELTAEPAPGGVGACFRLEVPVGEDGS